MKRTARTYKGYRILPSSYAGFRWYVQREHPAGLPMQEALCPRVGSLRAARDVINDEIRFAGA